MGILFAGGIRIKPIPIKSITAVKFLLGAFFLYVGAIYVLVYAGSMVPAYIQSGELWYSVLYFMPKVIPFFVIGGYLFLKNKPGISVVNLALKALVVSALVIGVCVSVAAVFIDWRTLNMMLTQAYDWCISGWLVWNYAFVLAFFISYHMLRDAPFSFAYAFLSVSAGGIVYEMPVCYGNYQAYYHPDFPIVINTQWISLAFLVVMLYWKRWRPNKIVWFGFLVYGVGSVFYALYRNGLSFGSSYFEWVARVPTVVMFLLLLFGLKKTRGGIVDAAA